MASKDVLLMRARIEALIAPLDDNAPWSALASQFLRMYEDLDKAVRRSDKHSMLSRVFGQVGAATTAAASAVAGTSLAAGASGGLATWVGFVAAGLGVVGGVTTSLNFGESVKRNHADHARYLPLLRRMGTYAAVKLPTATSEKIGTYLDNLAKDISAIEAADAEVL